MEIDLSFLSQIDPRVIQTAAIILGSLVILFILGFFIQVFIWVWLPYKQMKYLDAIDFIMLAIDVPKENVQSPKAVEHLFVNFMGAYSGPIKKERYFEGAVEIPFSFEIVAIDGYIQYVVRCASFFREFVEAAVFAQYPDAQITEVMDYVNTIPQQFPDDTYDLWGTELKLMRNEAYPLRTYQYFEHSLSQEFKDPMAGLLEQFGQMKKGEQAWFQITAAATLGEWQTKGNALVKELVGEKVVHKKTWVERLTDPILNLFSFAADNIVVRAEAQQAAQSQYEPVNKMQNLTPGEQLVISAIQMKLSKIGMKCQVRFIYTGPKTTFSKARGVGGPFGAINQFNSMDLNALIPGRLTTSAYYFFTKSRLARKQNKILRAYRKRLCEVGAHSKPFILNIEELATLWHFPDMNVKTPLIKKAEAKRAEPPSSLPFEGSIVSSGPSEPTFGGQQAPQPVQVSPVEHAAEVMPSLQPVDFSNKQFEERFSTGAPTQTADQFAEQQAPESKQEQQPAQSGPSTPAAPVTKTSPAPATPSPVQDSGDQQGSPPPNLPI